MIDMRVGRDVARSLLVLLATIALAVGCTTVMAPPTPGLLPPEARLVAGTTGDPVAGQLGTFTWLDGGSDSPWLPGTPVVVPARTDLRVGFDPALPVSSWTATVVPASADGPAGAATLGRGDGTDAPVDFDGPEAGSWTVRLHAVFANGLGEASWFWGVAVE
jgi:hypothetical protein